MHFLMEKHSHFVVVLSIALIKVFSDLKKPHCFLLFNIKLFVFHLLSFSYPPLLDVIEFILRNI